MWYLSQIFLLVIIYTNGKITSILSNPSSVESSFIIPNYTISINNTDDEHTVSTMNKGTTITESKICGPDESNGINVTYRTSTMFTALITYNCSSINSSKLLVFVNETQIDNCRIVQDFSDNMNNSKVNVICDHIENNAGRNWTFTIGQNFLRSQMILNETFTITLNPLPLNTSTYIDINIDDDLTSALVFIPNCTQISDPKYLVFRCNSSDLSNNILSKNCTHTCFGLEPGSIYNASLVRLPIPIVDKAKNKNENIFEEESLNKIYITGLDKATNLSFEEDSTDKTTVLIYFDRPRGNFDQIYLNCLTQDEYCLNETTTLTNNCSNCNFISISPIVRGVEYKCQALTIKENFTDVTSDKLNFNTTLESVLYEKSGQDWYWYTSHFVLDVTPQSDFDQLESICIVDINQTFPCSNLKLVHNQCSTTFEHNGLLGCNYQCYFVTKKSNYNDKYSNNYTMHLIPPQIKMFVFERGSRWTSINWTLSEPVYIKSFEVTLNQSKVETVDKTIFSYNYTKLLPNRDYKFRVKLISNYEKSSDPITMKTFEDAPKRPNADDIEKKILSKDNDTESTTDQHVIEIDRSLFSNEYGIIRQYSFYVRQDMNKNESEPDFNGTYAAAWHNPSIDYLAIVLPIYSPRNYITTNENKIRLIIGNETCKNNSISLIPCNDKLKPNTNYTLIMRACTNAGCTPVLSKIFRTKIENPSKDPSKSIIWTLIFLILALLIVAGLAIWKRQKVKSFYDNKIKKSKKISEPSILYKNDESISLAPIVKEMRPKLLIKYINMTHEDEKVIYAEYQELEKKSFQYRQLKHQPDYAVYNRYPNISARGPWDRTAVRLTGKHRLYDYINANEIKSYDNKKQYIACQGPLKDTCQDFWDMIIQYNVSIIVMLTRTEEQDPHNPSQLKSKCYHYFPTNIGETLIFDGIAVKVIDFEYYDDTDLEIRYITVKENDTEHHVIHYYFTGWPDFTVVEPRKLLDLIETINEHGQHSYNSYERIIKASSAPTVVHCSAGIGRTGTYIAVDTIIRLLNRTHRELPTMKLDVMGIVYQLRKDRGKMVQTRDQYMLINRCVEEHLKRTHRLNIILKQSNLYENVNARPSASSKHIYINLQKSNNRIMSRSNIDPSTHSTNLAEKTSLSQRSNTTISVVNGYSNRSNAMIQRSIYYPLNDNYYPKTEHNDRKNYILPPIPPRRTLKAQSSI